MRVLTSTPITLFLLFISLNSYCQPEDQEIKGKKIIKELDLIIDNSELLGKKSMNTDSIFLAKLDTIQKQVTKIKTSLKRNTRYAEQYKDDYVYYNELFTYANSLLNQDSVNGIVNEIMEDMMLKTKSPVRIDTTMGPGSAKYGSVNLQVRVMDNINQALPGFEVFLKKGTYIPSRDSVRIPGLTDNAIMLVSPGNFTIVAWRGGQCATAPVKIMRKPEPFICEVKLKQ